MDSSESSSPLSAGNGQFQMQRTSNLDPSLIPEGPLRRASHFDPSIIPEGPFRRGQQLEVLQAHARASIEANQNSWFHSTLLDEVWHSSTSPSKAVRGSVSTAGVGARRTFVAEEGERLQRALGVSNSRTWPPEGHASSEGVAPSRALHSMFYKTTPVSRMFKHVCKKFGSSKDSEAASTQACSTKGGSEAQTPPSSTSDTPPTPPAGARPNVWPSPSDTIFSNDPKDLGSGEPMASQPVCISEVEQYSVPSIEDNVWLPREDEDLPDMGELPSRGSAGHDIGECKPCVFHQRERCQNGVDCNYCHVAHDKPRRPGKKVRDQRKKRLEAAGVGVSVKPPPSDGGFDDGDPFFDGLDVDVSAEEPMPKMPASKASAVDGYPSNVYQSSSSGVKAFLELDVLL